MADIRLTLRHPGSEKCATIKQEIILLDGRHDFIALQQEHWLAEEELPLRACLNVCIERSVAG